MKAEETRPAHWDHVYERAAETVSWYQAEARVSLELLASAAIGPSESVLDIGGGASTFVDGLLERGYADITVLDITDRALAVARSRLGSAARDVHWLQADITTWSPQRTYGCWHDRAVFHFLTEPADREAYRNCLARAIEAGGAVIIGTFAEDGPERCSDLPVRRYSLQELRDELSDVATLVESRRELHHTPSGGVQSFLFARFVRV